MTPPAANIQGRVEPGFELVAEELGHGFAARAEHWARRLLAALREAVARRLGSAGPP